MDANTKTCPVCGAKMILNADAHYVVRDDTSTGLAMLAGGHEPPIYDAVDCPECGCQVILGKRKRPLVESATLAVEETGDETAPTEDKITTTREEIEQIVTKAVHDALVDAQADNLGAPRKGWMDVGRVFRAASQHGRKPALGYVGTMCETARFYCEQHGVSIQAFEDKWVEYMNNPDSSIDSAYGMARLRTRGGKNKRRNK